MDQPRRPPGRAQHAGGQRRGGRGESAVEPEGHDQDQYYKDREVTRFHLPNDVVGRVKRCREDCDQETTFVRMTLGFIMRPNESRSSCGALVKNSFLNLHRRQLQALVRPQPTRSRFLVVQLDKKYA